jgi:prevent-host-death family protein
MSSPEREIPERDLRNKVGEVLREVAAGAHLRITVRGRPVADLVPISGGSRFVQRSEVDRILRSAPLDLTFSRDLDQVVGGRVDEL